MIWECGITVVTSVLPILLPLAVPRPMPMTRPVPLFRPAPARPRPHRGPSPVLVPAPHTAVSRPQSALGVNVLSGTSFPADIL